MGPGRLRCLVVLYLGSAVAMLSAAEPPAFRSAKPVWPKGRETEMNLTVGFRAVFDAPAERSQKVVLRVAAATIYRAWLNGEFLGCGPARGPHGYFRVDEWDLSAKLSPGKNLVAVEVAGYNCNSYYLLDQPSFCQAEVTAGDRVVASTAGAGVPFAAGILDCRVQKVQRYSFQRPFIEVYRLRSGWDRWFRDAAEPFGVPTTDILERRAELHRQLQSALGEYAKQASPAMRPPFEAAQKDSEHSRKQTDKPKRSEKEIQGARDDKGAVKNTTSELPEIKREAATLRKQIEEQRKELDEQRKRLEEEWRALQAMRARDEQMRKRIEDVFRAQAELRRLILCPHVDAEIQQPKRLLPRHALYPDFKVRRPVRLVAAGRVERRDVEKFWKDRSLINIGPKLKGYPEKRLAVIPSLDMQRWANIGAAPLDEPWPPSTRLAEHGFAIADFGADLTGFVGAKVTCAKPSRLVFTFDEILTHGDVDFKRLGCVNVLTYYLEPGQYRIESIEPYTMRYLKLVCLEGECNVEGLYLREYAHPPPKVAKFHASDERLNRLFAAGVSTFRQNALDIFMDCPSRERAGWLCDSFFTSRVAFDLDGNTAIEHNFFENFLLPARFAHLPDGMLPMCYPADHYDGVYIPNWAMWFVIQLDEYLARSGDRATVDGLRPKVFKLLEFLKKYENSDGLLEKLPSWVFVEWSKANDFVQDVNYPSNMLYAGTLAAAGRMYRAKDLLARAEKVRETIRKQSFDGHFFVDNAVRRDGKLQVTRNHSEVCQYFAFFFGVANRTSHAELWRVLRDEFGPEREKTKAHADVYAANSFVGNMLRMELLSQADRGQQILDESVAYLLYMAERTGTLWENVGAYASCNHGFASHIVHTLYRDILGVRRISPLAKRITIRFQNLKLKSCEGTLPTSDGPVTLRWRVEHGQLQYRLTHPAGYTATVENASGKRLQQL